MFILIMESKDISLEPLIDSISTDDDSVEQEVCSICLEMYNENMTMLSECGHVFHDECINELVKASNKNTFNCPNCRSEYIIDIEDVEETNEEIPSHPIVAIRRTRRIPRIRTFASSCGCVSLKFIGIYLFLFLLVYRYQAY